MPKLFFFHLIVILWLFISFGVSINAQEGWKSIIPLISTRDDVEKKFGKPNRNGFYELKEGRVSIGYVEMKCEKIIRCSCVVPLGTVSYINIEIYNDLLLKDLKLNLKTFKKTIVSNNPEILTYSNPITGVVYEVYEGKVSHIYYYESRKTCKKVIQKQQR